MKNFFLFLLFSTVVFGQTLPNVTKSGGATTDNSVPRYDSTTGRIIKNSGVVIDDSGNVIATNITNQTVNPIGNALISGGGRGFVSGLQFTVGAAQYSIQGTIYNSPTTPLTAAAADPTFDRIDVVALTSSNTAVIIQGTPSANPAAPDVDPTTQLQLTFYILAANAVVLPVSVADIYHENTEWTTSKVGTPINLASTNNPYRGTVDIEGTAVVAGNSFTFAAPSNFDTGTYNNLIFYVAPKAAWPNPKQFSVQFFDNSNVAVGSIVTFKTGTFGFNSSSTVNTYQQVVIPLSLFGANGITTARKLKFTCVGGGGSFGFYMDDFTLQAGLSGTTQSSGTVNFKGVYSSTLNYNLNDEVLYGTPITRYIALAANLGKTPPAPANPPSSTAFWAQSAGAGFENLTGPITSVGKATSVAAQTGTGSTFVMNTSPTIATGTFTTPLLSGITTQTGTTVLTPAPMAALVVDVTQRENTKTIAADQTFTFSGTPATSGQWFGVLVTNSDSVAHTVTIPSSLLVGASPGGAITTVSVPATGQAFLNWQYIGTTYYLNSGGTSGGITALTGDVTATGPGSAAATLANTAVTPASYTNTSLTVDSKGRITAASSGTAAPSAANPTATISGSAVNGSASTFMRSDAAPALANTAVTAASYTNTNLTVDAQGRITAASNGSAGSGTVTSVSVTTANGVSGSVATATTTPAITLTLGAITPTTVNGNTFTTGSSTYTGAAAQTYTMPATSATLFGSTTKADVLEAAMFGSDAGSTDDYAVTLSPAITAYVTGAHYWFKANTANTGAATLNLNALGAKTIVKAAGGITTALATNDIRAGQWVDVAYDGTNMQMQSLLGNAPSGSGTVTTSGSPANTYIPYFTTSTNITGNSGFTFDGTGAVNLTPASGAASIVINSADSVPFSRWSVGGTEKATVGIASGTNSLVTGSVANDFCFRTGGNILLSTSSTGANFGLKLSTGNILSGPSNVLTVEKEIDLTATSGNAQLYLNSPAGSSPQLAWSLAGTQNGLIGVSGAADQLITGSVSGDVCLRTTGGNLLFSTNNGGAIAQKIVATTGQVSMLANIASTTTATGSLIVTGGVGISGNVSPLRLNATGGVVADSGGIKHARVTTGSVSAASTALVTITWTTAFPDTNYTVQASVVDSTTSSLSLSVVHIESITASAVTVRVINNAAGSLTGTVHVIAMRD